MSEPNGMLVRPAAGLADATTSEVKRAETRWAFIQAQASSRIEGHIPDTRYKADCEAVIAGTMTVEQALANSIERALEEDRRAAHVGGNNGT